MGKFLEYAREAKGYFIWVPNQHNNGGMVKVQWDIIFHGIDNTTATPPIPWHYMLLWDTVDFPDHISVNNDKTLYVHAQQHALSMTLM
jgi:hypothetical protein